MQSLLVKGAICFLKLTFPQEKKCKSLINRALEIGQEGPEWGEMIKDRKMTSSVSRTHVPRVYYIGSPAN